MREHKNETPQVSENMTKKELKREITKLMKLHEELKNAAQSCESSERASNYRVAGNLIHQAVGYLEHQIQISPPWEE